jgi:hypothetical protein
MLNCELDIILCANCNINWLHGPFDDNEHILMELMNLSLHLSHCSHQCFVNVLLHGCHWTPCLSLNSPLKKSCWLWLSPLNLIWLDFVSNIMRLLGFKNLLVLAKYNTHNLFFDHVELNLFDNWNLSTSWTWPMWNNMASHIHLCKSFSKIPCQNCTTWAFVIPWVTLMRWCKWA